eukprot:scaffold236_cov419-Prasinococcus_capsulatus_cf.AAC.30
MMRALARKSWAAPAGGRPSGARPARQPEGVVSPWPVPALVACKTEYGRGARPLPLHHDHELSRGGPYRRAGGVGGGGAGGAAATRTIPAGQGTNARPPFMEPKRARGEAGGGPTRTHRVRLPRTPAIRTSSRATRAA